MRFAARPLFALVAALLVTGGVAACGGSGGDAKKIVSETFSANKKINSANLALVVDVTPRGSGSPLSIKLTGPFQNQGPGQVPRFDLTLGFTLQGQSISAGAVSTGDAGFVKLQGQAYSLPQQVFASFRQSLQQTSAQLQRKPNQGPLAQLGINPQNWLKNPTNQGSADIDATSTDHISAQVDVPKLLTDLSTIRSKAGPLGLNGSGQAANALSPQQIQAAESAVKQAHLDVYSAKSDHSLRRLTLDVDYTPPSGSPRAIHLDLQFLGLNQPQTVAAPANTQPLANLTSTINTLTGGRGLGGLLGGGSGSGSGSGSGGSGAGSPAPGSGGALAPGSATPSPSSSANAAVAKCLQDAGADTAKATQCLSPPSK